MSTIQATRMRKGMLVKIENDLFRVLELQHVTPGNLRGFVRVKFRNIRSGTLSDQKLRSEDTVERATLDEVFRAELLVRQRSAADVAELHADEPAQVARRDVLQVEHAEQIVADLHQHALLHSRGLNRTH